MHQNPSISERGDRCRLALGVAFSVTLHVVVLVALIAAPLATRAAAREVNRPELDEERELENEIRLGNPDSQVTSFTWIGYEEYQEQYSPVPSPVDQAQLTQSPRAPVPLETPLTQTSPDPTPTPPAPRESLAGGAARESTIAPEAPNDAVEQVLASLEQPPVDLPAEIPVDVALNEQSQASEETTDESRAEGAGDAEETIRLAPMSGSPDSEPGELSDRQSAFSATMKHEDFLRGKPLAGRGLYVQTVRPRPTMFSQVTRLMRSPQSRSFRVFFRADGTVDRAQSVEERSIPEIDRPMLDVLYRWRARGPQLDALQEGRSDETISVEIRILFGRR